MEKSEIEGLDEAIALIKQKMNGTTYETLGAELGVKRAAVALALAGKRWELLVRIGNFYGLEITKIVRVRDAQTPI